MDYIIMFYRHIRILSLGIIFFLFTLTLHSAVRDEIIHRSFWQPTYHGVPLNYCLPDGTSCGYKVANRYCCILGYERASQQLIANNVGMSIYLSNGQKCSNWRCNGFKVIHCTKRLSHRPAEDYHYRLRHFYYPRYKHYRVAWCYDGKTGCGRRAAHSFCRRLGFTKSHRYTIEKDIAATQAIGNQKLCFGKGCNAFKEISCYR